MKNKTFEYRGFVFKVYQNPNANYNVQYKETWELTGYGKSEEEAIRMAIEKTDALFAPTTSIEELAQKIHDTANTPDYEEFDILPEVLAILLANYKPR
jgi:hypothetical protein